MTERQSVLHCSHCGEVIAVWPFVEGRFVDAVAHCFECARVLGLLREKSA